jgi:hypothetical protein
VSCQDPEKLLDRVVDEMSQDAARMRQASAQAIAAQRQMAARANSMQVSTGLGQRHSSLAPATVTTRSLCLAQLDVFHLILLLSMATCARVAMPGLAD